VGDRRPASPAEHGPSRLAEWASAVTARADSLQQRHRAVAVPCAVIHKYADDQAGRLSGQISYAAFLSVFPLLLVLVTVVGIVLAGHPSLQDDIINSALRQFPVVGSDLRNNVRQLSTSNVLAATIGLIWLAYGSMKLSRSAQVMMAAVWGIGRNRLPRFSHWLPRAAGFLVIVGVGFIAGGALAGLGAFGRLGGLSAWVGLVLSLVVNFSMYWGGFAIVVRIPEGKRAVWPGAVIGGAGWTALQFAGAMLVNHQLRHLSNLYGTFATVLGLIWWLAIGSIVTVYAAEFNVVVTRHLWPRSLRGTRQRTDGEDGSAEGEPQPVAEAGTTGRAARAS